MGKPESKTTTVRDSRFELLRVLAMLCIVLCHVVAINGWGLEQQSDATGIVAVAIDQYFGQFGVALFFMLPGFFLSHRVSIDAWHVGKTVIQVFIYSMLCLVVVLTVFHMHVSFRDMYRSLFPIINGTYWFVTAYVLMMLFAPFVNIIFNHCNQRMHGVFILMLLSLSVVPYVSFIGFAYDGLQWTTALYAICCYSIGAYVQRYGVRFRRRIRLVWIPVCAIAGFVLVTIFLWASMRQIWIARIFEWQPRSIFGSLPIFAILVASLVLLTVSQAPQWQGDGLIRRAINMTASVTFGIYLIHQHPVLLSPLWNVIGRVFPYPGSAVAGAVMLMAETVMLFIVWGIAAWAIDHLLVHPAQKMIRRLCSKHQ